MTTGLDHEVPMTELNDNDVNNSVMLPRGNSYTRWKAIQRKIDADGNAFERTNNNPILDMREYCVYFYNGEVSELTENLIAESMYTACDYSVNEYMMMDSIVNHQNSDKAVSVYNKKVMHRY